MGGRREHHSRVLRPGARAWIHLEGLEITARRTACPHVPEVLPSSPSDPRERDLPREHVPLAESLKDTVARFVSYWRDTIGPAVTAGQRAVIVAHGNSLRALVKYLDAISDDDIVELNIPTGVPLVYRLDEYLNPINHYYLGDDNGDTCPCA